MRHKQTPDRPRIKTKADAERCIAGLMNYFYRHDSPLAAEDLQDAVAILRRPDPPVKEGELL